jgi:glycosyltransferase involved in cell wall biosynthesis
MMMPGLLKKLNPDLFLSPDGYLSLRSDVKSLAVFHDLNFEHYPEDIPFAARKHFRYYFPKYARKAARIATVSEFSRSDIVNLYGVPAEKIDVVYDGANEQFNPVTADEKQQVIGRYSGGQPYFVFIGSLHPRKNLVNLFRAYDIFRKENNSNVKLLIVGARMWWTGDIEKAYNSMTFKDDVVFSGRLNAAELGRVLGSALALTYVSYFEGFGIPIVEAFRCDVPVITSNVTSMPEIAGDAALLADPFDPASIAREMGRIWNEPGLREELILKGRSRKEMFTWQRSADLLWDSIVRTINS